ncbi:MAG: hypothetical protein EOP38_06355 [Rubrivivax sp.]|nr:MAG: hypothetical protein EOP38_06355 [Rubrivivax sp.]
MTIAASSDNMSPTNAGGNMSPWLRAWVMLSIAAFVGYVAYATVTSRAFYADGSAFYLSIVTTPEAFNHFDDSKHIRLLVNIVNQLPVMLLSKWDDAPPALLRMAFNFPLFAGNAILLGMLWISARRHGTYLVWTYALISYITTIIPSDIFPINQARLAQTIYWCLLFFATVPGPMSKWEKFFVGLLIIVSFRSHEAIIIFGPLLSVAAYLGMRQSTHDRPWRQALLATGIGLLLFGIFWQLSHPVGRETSGFLNNFKYWGNKEWWRSNLFLAWSGLVTLLVAVLISRVQSETGRRAPRYLAFIYGLICVLNGLQPCITKSALMPQSEFSFRVIIPFFGAMLVCAALVDMRKRLSASLSPHVVIGIAASALLGQSLWQLANTYRWNQFYTITRTVITGSSTPLISSEDVQQAMPPRLARYLMNYQWGWTWPAFSMAVLDAHEVRTLVKPNDHQELFYISRAAPDLLHIPFGEVRSGRFDMSAVTSWCKPDSRAAFPDLCRD